VDAGPTCSGNRYRSRKTGSTGVHVHAVRGTGGDPHKGATHAPGSTGVKVLGGRHGVDPHRGATYTQDSGGHKGATHTHDLCEDSQQGGPIKGTISAATLNRNLLSVAADRLPFIVPPC